MGYIRPAKYVFFVVLFMLFLIEKKTSSYLLKWPRYTTQHFSKDFYIVYYLIQSVYFDLWNRNSADTFIT